MKNIWLCSSYMFALPGSTMDLCFTDAASNALLVWEDK